MKVILSLFLVVVASAQHDPSNAVTYDERYLDGLNAYSSQRWSEANVHLRQTLNDYNRVVEARVKCYARCKQDKPRVPQDYPRDRELGFFHGVIQRAACIERCKEDYVGARPTSGVPSYIKRHMEDKEAYNYLQMSLYQDKKIKEAARACATYAYYNPRNIHVTANMKYYRGHPDVTQDDMKPLIPLAYRDLYREGQELYFKEDWLTMVETFESSLIVFYSALEDCRTLCDGPLHRSKTLDFTQVMTKQFISVLECRTNCIEKLGMFRDDRNEDFFGSYFHYLQFGYYQMNHSLDAIQASATQVYLEPHSEVAKRNSVFYRQQPGVTRKDFLPREDVLPLIKKLEEEHDFLHIVDELSGHLTEVSKEGDSPDGDDNIDEELLEQDFKNYPIGSHQPPLLEEIKPIVSMKGEELKGEERVVMDEFLTQKQCDLLIELADHGKEGDGYSRKSPHTQFEKFQGLNILDAAKLSDSGTVEKSLTRLYMNASRRVKDSVAHQFNLQTPLYFSFSHLVCRTAKDGMQDVRDDLSHPVHSDNCVLDEATGECNKVPPAYTWRDYSAILYLNGNFEGGKFFFAHSPKDLSPEVYLTPKCGRMVGFSAGKESMHGVSALTSGKRCCVALWFTLDPAYAETSFELAEDIMSGIAT